MEIASTSADHPVEVTLAATGHDDPSEPPPTVYPIPSRGMDKPVTGHLVAPFASSVHTNMMYVHLVSMDGMMYMPADPMMGGTGAVWNGPQEPWFPHTAHSPVQQAAHPSTVGNGLRSRAYPQQKRGFRHARAHSIGPSTREDVTLQSADWPQLKRSSLHAASEREAVPKAVPSCPPGSFWSGKTTGASSDFTNGYTQEKREISVQCDLPCGVSVAAGSRASVCKHCGRSSDEPVLDSCKVPTRVTGENEPAQPECSAYGPANDWAWDYDMLNDAAHTDFAAGIFADGWECERHLLNEDTDMCIESDSTVSVPETQPRRLPPEPSTPPPLPPREAYDFESEARADQINGKAAVKCCPSSPATTADPGSADSLRSTPRADDIFEGSAKHADGSSLSCAERLEQRLEFLRKRCQEVERLARIARAAEGCGVSESSSSGSSDNGVRSSQTAAGECFQNAPSHGAAEARQNNATLPAAATEDLKPNSESLAEAVLADWISQRTAAGHRKERDSQSLDRSVDADSENIQNDTFEDSEHDDADGPHFAEVTADLIDAAGSRSPIFNTLDAGRKPHWTNILLLEDDNASCSSEGVADENAGRPDVLSDRQAGAVGAGASSPQARKNKRGKKPKPKKNDMKHTKSCEDEEAWVQCDVVVSQSADAERQDVVITSSTATGSTQPRCCSICGKPPYTNTLAKRVGLCKVHFREMQTFEKVLTEMHASHWSSIFTQDATLHCFASNFWTLSAHHSHLRDADKGVAFYKSLAHFLVARGADAFSQNIIGSTPFQLAVDVTAWAPQAVIAVGHAMKQVGGPFGGQLSTDEAAQCALAEEALSSWSIDQIQALWDDTNRNIALAAYWQRMSAERRAEATTAYLPKTHNGQTLLEHAGSGLWKVVSATGVEYRKTKHLDDKVIWRRGPEYGQLIKGADEEDGWIRCFMEGQSRAALADNQAEVE